jgi:putative phosphoribosyl transferase
MFKNRRDAGEKLAEKLKKYKNKKDIIVLGLLRGGMVVADEISKRLGLSLDILMVRKLGLPFDREMAVGAIADGLKEVILDEEIIRKFNISDKEINEEINREKKEMKQRLEFYGKKELI